MAPNWALRYMEVGEQKYGLAVDTLPDTLKYSGMNEGIRKANQFFKQTNADYVKKWTIAGKDFNHLSAGDVYVMKPLLATLDLILDCVAPLNYMTHKPCDYYANPEHVTETLRPKGVEFKTGTEFSDSVRTTIEQWEWNDWFTFKNWREEILPHVLRTRFTETLDKKQDELAQQLRKDNVPEEEQKKQLQQLAADFGADFEKYTEYLANNTEYLAKPIRAFDTKEAREAESRELDQLSHDVHLGESLKERRGKLQELYNKFKPVMSESDLEKRINARMKGKPVAAPTYKDVKNRKEEEKKAVSAAETKADARMPLPENTPTWVAKAAGYDTRGKIQQKLDSLKEGAYSWASGKLDALKDSTADMVIDWRKSKVLLGKNFAPLSFGTLAKSQVQKSGTNYGVKRVKEYLKEYPKYVNGNDICEYALSGQIGVDPELAVELYNVTGVELGANSINEKIKKMISDSPWKDYFKGDQWKTEIMPHLLRTAYKEQLSELQENILQRFNGDEALANKDLLAQSMSAAANKLGEIYEKYSLDMANQTDYLAAPLTMRKDSRFAENTLNQFKGLPKKDYEALKKTLTQDNQLFNAAEISKEIQDRVKSFKTADPEKSLQSIINRKKPDNQLEQSSEATQDQNTMQYLKGILAIREMKRKNENRGFLRKHLFNGEYKRQKAAIEKYEAELSKKFNFPEAGTKNMTDLKNPIEQGISTGDVLGIEKKTYVPEGFISKAVKDGAAMVGRGVTHAVSTMEKVASWSAAVAKETGKFLYENSGAIINVVTEKDSLKAIAKRAGNGAVNMAKKVGTSVVDGTVSLTKKGVNLAANVAYNTGAKAYDLASYVGGKAYNFIFGGSSEPKQESVQTAESSPKKEAEAPRQDKEIEAQKLAAEEAAKSKESQTAEKAVPQESEAQRRWNMRYDRLNEHLANKLHDYQNEIMQLEKLDHSKVLHGFAGIVYCKTISDMVEKMRSDNSVKPPTDSELSQQTDKMTLLQGAVVKNEIEKDIQVMTKQSTMDMPLFRTMIAGVPREGDTLSALKQKAQDERAMDKFYQSYLDARAKAAEKAKQAAQKKQSAPARQQGANNLKNGVKGPAKSASL